MAHPAEQAVFHKAAAALEPMSAAERSTALAHFYRGELARMTGWRDRIDRTSNWSITVVAALLSVSLSTPQSHHGVVLFGTLIVSLLLHIEARRYRFFDIYRARVRLLERCYFAPLFDPPADMPADWSAWMAASLARPQFLISQGQAIVHRLKRNYGWMYLILLLAWALKITSPKIGETGIVTDPVTSLREVAAHAALGPIPGDIVLGFMLILHGLIFGACLMRSTREGAFMHGEAHV